MDPINYYVCNARGEEATPSCFFQTVLQHNNQRCATFSFSTLPCLNCHVKSGEMKVQKKKAKENKGLGKTGKE
jgi:hypothetical protein